MASQPPLAPLRHSLGRNPNSVAQYQDILTIQQEGGGNGGNFHVQDSSGQPVLRCQGKRSSTTQRTNFFLPGAPEGSSPIFILRKHRCVWLNLYKFYINDPNIRDPNIQDPNAEDPRGLEIVQLNRQFGLFGMRLKITFKNTAHDGQPVELKLKGGFWEKSAVITWNDEVVARMRKQSSFTAEGIFQRFLGRDRYVMEVAPGCDMVLFAAMIVCLDEAYKDSEEKK